VLQLTVNGYPKRSGAPLAHLISEDFAVEELRCPLPGAAVLGSVVIFTRGI
jgi:hypothetical protein